jgi:hypothetical protein
MEVLAGLTRLNDPVDLWPLFNDIVVNYTPAESSVLMQNLALGTLNFDSDMTRALLSFDNYINFHTTRVAIGPGNPEFLMMSAATSGPCRPPYIPPQQLLVPAMPAAQPSGALFWNRTASGAVLNPFHELVYRSFVDPSQRPAIRLQIQALAAQEPDPTRAEEMVWISDHLS